MASMFCIWTTAGKLRHGSALPGRLFLKGRFRPRLVALEVRTAPAVFAVNSLADTVAANLTTGQDAFGDVTLRSAVQAANSLHGTNTIRLPAGDYKLTRVPGADRLYD